MNKLRHIKDFFQELNYKDKIAGIYKLTSPSGKIYIGRTLNLYGRLNNYINLHCEGQRYLYNALLKYGVDNFKIDILFKTDKKYQYIDYLLNAIERRVIKTSKSTDRDIGYNIKSGGNGGKHSEETKKLMGAGNRGKKRSEEFKLNISKRMSGIKQSAEHKKKRSDSMKGKNAVPISQFTKQGEFIRHWDSVTEALTVLKMSSGSIANNIAGRSKSAGGFVWKHKE